LITKRLPSACVRAEHGSVKDGLNWYQYVGSNLTTYVDPTGESLISPFAGFAKLAGSAATAVKSAAGSISNTANKASKSLGK